MPVASRRVHQLTAARWSSPHHTRPQGTERERDLEQELADVSDLILRLKEEAPEETTTV